jgi:ubiquitin carboxyl-terminal hydrolase 8
MGIFFNNKNNSNLNMNNIEKNINNCYINASLQTFLHLNDFITDVRSINIKDNKKDNMKLTIEFKKLINQYINNENNFIVRNIDPIKIKKILSEINEKYKYNYQEDANEFITIFLNEMMKEVKGIGINDIEKIKIPDDDKSKIAFSKLEFKFFNENKSFLTNLFYGRFKKEIICPNNHIIKVSFEVYNMIQLPIIDKKGNDKQDKTIEQFLTKFQEKRFIDGEIECKECQKKNYSYFSKTTIYNLPFYIILLLNNQDIRYSEHFTIKVKEFIEREKNNNDIYELVGVIGYYGNYRRGHYFTKCKYNNEYWIYYYSDKTNRKKNLLEMDRNTDTILFFKKALN